MRISVVVPTLNRVEDLRRCLAALARQTRPADRIVVVVHDSDAATQEALAARCPMIVNQIVPGQEEGNYELLRRYEVGALAETPGAVITELQRAFAGRAAVWQAWRTALAPLSRPYAAIEIAESISVRAAELTALGPAALSMGARPSEPQLARIGRDARAPGN